MIINIIISRSHPVHQLVSWSEVYPTRHSYVSYQQTDQNLFKCKLSYFSKVRPQSSGGASSQPGADEEENRVFLLVVGLGSQVRFNLGSQVQLDEHILVASQRFYLDITVLGILDFPSR